MVVLTLFLGLVLGAFAAWLLASRQRAAVARELSETRSELAGTRAELDVERRSFDQKVVTAVRAASADAYQANSSAFLEIAESKLTGYVRPLKESLAKVEGQVQTLELARERSQGALREQLTQLSERTASLVTALRTPHVRGRWGEIQLKRVVELAGMLPYCDFDEQVTAATDDGRLRPDMKVRLPGGKNVIVDAKVPLAAYLDACEATDDAERARHLESHARQVRDHMTKLSAKSYWQQFGDTPDFVVMFLPDETFFRAALEHDPSLIEAGVEAGVVPASPTTLIGLLRVIAYGWQQETVAESAREVSELGRELYERLSVLGRHFAKLGRSLDGAVAAYNETVGSLESRVLVTARRFETHGISGELPAVEPLDRQARPLQAVELTLPLELAPPNDADAA
jgi:DNA recombination protein RmuC